MWKISQKKRVNFCNSLVTLFCWTTEYPKKFWRKCGTITKPMTLMPTRCSKNLKN